MNSLQSLANQLDEKIGSLRLAVAESCTGGLLGSTITDIPGSSRYFPGGIISYSNEVKHLLLKVPQELLVEYGAVSRQVVETMATGVKELLSTDLAVAISGIAGPGGGTVEKPVGLVYICAISCKDKITKEHLFSGNRHQIKEQSVQQALEHLLRIL